DDCKIPESVAPRINYLGFMLPYSPLHHLLTADFHGPLVLTSGNISDEPIAYSDEDAFERLSGIADCYLTHNREIHIRCDDSVIRVTSGQPCMIRRSRGYAPDPITVPFDFSKPILACGAELKNTFCLARKNYAFVSHHIGDLENLETLKSFEEGIEHFKKLFDIEPEAVAYDLHPEYLSTKYALDLSVPVKIVIQHHHAHIASCMADNDIAGDVIGVAMDGLGFGLDGSFWGCEFIVANLETFQRMAHLHYLPMPGGTSAIREPWRMAATYLNHAYGEKFLSLDLDFVKRLDLQKWKLLEKMHSRELNSPLTSSMGRCFDAVSSLLGIRDRIHYEGEAAIELEMIASKDHTDHYRFE
ncbi:Sua5/YciO/YrdC/YwlC family protein, partial [bacterium]|nr:Sua5/YciO/YrdC/YwlC family protein [bacterium]